jgi:hypothetical protein
VVYSLEVELPDSWPERYFHRMSFPRMIFWILAAVHHQSKSIISRRKLRSSIKHEIARFANTPRKPCHPYKARAVSRGNCWVWGFFPLVTPALTTAVDLKEPRVMLADRDGLEERLDLGRRAVLQPLEVVDQGAQVLLAQDLGLETGARTGSSKRWMTPCEGI